MGSWVNIYHNMLILDQNQTNLLQPGLVKSLKPLAAEDNVI